MLACVQRILSRKRGYAEANRKTTAGNGNYNTGNTPPPQSAQSMRSQRSAVPVDGWQRDIDPETGAAYWWNPNNPDDTGHHTGTPTGGQK